MPITLALSLTVALLAQSNSHPLTPPPPPPQVDGPAVAPPPRAAAPEESTETEGAEPPRVTPLPGTQRRSVLVEAEPPEPPGRAVGRVFATLGAGLFVAGAITTAQVLLTTVQCTGSTISGSINCFGVYFFVVFAEILLYVALPAAIALPGWGFHQLVSGKSVVGWGFLGFAVGAVLGGVTALLVQAARNPAPYATTDVLVWSACVSGGGAIGSALMFEVGHQINRQDAPRIVPQVAMLKDGVSFGFGGTF